MRHLPDHRVLRHTASPRLPVAEAILRRERVVVLGALALVSAVAWIYTVSGVGLGGTMEDLTSGTGAMAMRPMAWTPGHALVMFFMWWVMMVAMMLPSAAPMALLFVAVNRRREAEAPFSATGIFLAGYLVTWAAGSALATLGQWGLERSGLLTASMSVSSAILGGAILLAAGLYQFTSLKGACLKHCRHPAKFIAEHWRPGRGGAFRMGLAHGAYCVGCCWFLMALLFFAGIMNTIWIAGLALYVALEKMVPHARLLSTACGLVLSVAGLWLILVAI